MPISEPFLKLSLAHQQFIEHISLGAYPHEACGLLLGHIIDGVRHVEEVIAARNVAMSPDCQFEINPEDLLRAHKQARHAGQSVLGHFHSHPNGSRTPSITDAANVEEIGQLWLIQAVSDVGALPLAAYLAVRDKHQGWPFIALAIKDIRS